MSKWKGRDLKDNEIYLLKDEGKFTAWIEGIMLEMKDSDMDVFLGYWTVWKDGFLTLRPDVCFA